MKYGYILVNPETHIEQARSQATYEETLDAKLLAVRRGWTYVPLGLRELIDELSNADVFKEEI